MGANIQIEDDIDAVVRSGKLLYQEIQRFRTIDEITAELRDIALNTKEGDIHFGLEYLRNSQSSNNENNHSLQGLLRHVETSLQAAQRSLSQVDGDSITGRLRYHLRGQSSKHHLERVLRELKASCVALEAPCQQASRSRRSHLLTSGVFQLVNETTATRPGRTLPHSDVVIAKAIYMQDSQSGHVDIVLEKKTVEEDVESICGTLSSPEAAREGGILPLLGYRQPPYNDQDGNDIFDLIFQLPENVTAESLAHRISDIPNPPNHERLKLCMSLSTVVEHVHALHLMHKRIRTRSILVLATADGRPSELYLQDWSRVRKLSDKTNGIEAGAWEKRIYQHPERQGTFAEADYEPRHDIYSLGVCMLEILLWTPFVVEQLDAQDVNVHRVCGIFENRGLQLGEQNVGEVNGALPGRFKGDSYRLTSRPWATRAIWKSIARTDIPDQDLAQVILQCLEGKLLTAAKVAERLRTLIEGG